MLTLLETRAFQGMSTSPGIALSLLVAFIVGCSDDRRQAPDPDAVVEREISVTRVFPTEWEVDGRTVPLTLFNSVATDGAGRVYIAQPMSSDVLILDAEGEFAGLIGRRGDGPGEFRAPLRLGVTVDGLIWVHDSALRRVSFFSSDTGALEEALPVPPSPQEIPTGLEPIGASLDGGMIATESLLPSRTSRGALAVGQFGIESDRHSLTSLGEYILLDRVLGLPGEVRGGTGYLDPPVTTADAFGVLGREVVSVAVPNRDMGGDTVLLILRDFRGDTLRVIRYPRTPIPMDEEFRRRHIDRITGIGVRGQYFATESRSRQVVSELLRFPAAWPPAQELIRTYRSDEIWLLVATPLDDRRLYERVRLLPDGAVEVERIRVPPGIRLVWIGEEAPLGVFEDDLGQPHLVTLAPP